MKRTVRVKVLSDTPFLLSEEPEDVIGRGSYGKVVRAYSKADSGKCYAVKVFELSSLKEHRSGLQELSIVSKLPRNPNLVCYEKIKLTSRNSLYLVMEECNGGTLSQLISRSQSLGESELLRFIADFLNGYRCLYECGIVHRDIKTDNVLLHNGSYKIADFGLSKFMQESSATTSIRGSPVFLAPELFRKGESGSKLDVYSFGVTLYFACYKRYPYTTKARYANLQQLMRDIECSELILPRGRSRFLEDLLTATLQKDPRKRADWPLVFKKCEYQAPESAIGEAHPQQGEQIQLHLHEVLTSNTDMRDLELLDMNLLLSLRPESVLILNDLERSLIRKRELILFLDRLCGKLRNTATEAAQDFKRTATEYSLQTIYGLEQDLVSAAQHMPPSDREQFTESRSYRIVTKLIEEDRQQLRAAFGGCPASTLRQLKIRLYKLCSALVMQLAGENRLAAAVYVAELQIFFDGDSSSVLSPGNKDIDSLDKFITWVEAASTEEHRNRLGGRYQHLFL